MTSHNHSVDVELPSKANADKINKIEHFVPKKITYSKEKEDNISSARS